MEVHPEIPVFLKEVGHHLLVSAENIVCKVALTKLHRSSLTVRVEEGFQIGSHRECYKVD